MRHLLKRSTLFVFLVATFTSCESLLNRKSDKSLAVPGTLEDFQAIMNNFATLNTNYIAAGEVSCDDNYLTDADINALNYESDKRLYTWQADNVSRTQSSAGDEWYNCYRAINFCNIVLHGLDQNELEGDQVDNLRGQALAFRAARLLDGLQVWSMAYNKETASRDLGMVLKTDPDMNLKSARASVEESYQQVINDLKKAIAVLPETQSGKTLPTKYAAHALLARTYLNMGEYELALSEAEKVYIRHRELIDFNELDPAANYPIPAVREASDEVIFRTSMFFAAPINISISKITPELYELYDDDDLRKNIFFKHASEDEIVFKGTHSGGTGYITGVTNNEIYLILAECHAVLGNLSEAEEFLNALLVKRWKTDSYVPYVFTDKIKALQVVREERRKELVRRGLRWADIKRYNRENSDITLTRIVNGESFTLYPNDKRYAIAIPEEVIEISGITQNPR